MKIKNLRFFCDLLNNKIKNSSTILIVSHTKPDPDCLFSQLALYSIFKKKYPKKEFILFNKNYFYQKDILKNINNDLILIKNKIEKLPSEIDLIIGIEITDEERLGLDKKFIDYSKIFIIDHHQSFSFKKSIYYLDKKSESCSIIIFKIAKIFNSKIDLKFKINILSGIIGDTVAFRYVSNKETFKILEELYDKRINLFSIIKNIYGLKFNEFKRILLLVDKIKLVRNKKLMFVYLENNKKIKKIGSFLEYLRLIKEIETIVFLVNKKDKIYGSLRSEKIDVSKIAKKLGGGGHKKSAGFVTNLPVKKIFRIILSYLN